MNSSLTIELANKVAEKLSAVKCKEDVEEILRRVVEVGNGYFGNDSNASTEEEEAAKHTLGFALGFGISSEAEDLFRECGIVHPFFCKFKINDFDKNLFAYGFLHSAQVCKLGPMDVLDVASATLSIMCSVFKLEEFALAHGGN